MADTATFALVGSIIAIALVFDYTNGFHDAANAIATAVGSKALTPKVALAIAALGNLAGAFISTSVASTVGSGIIAPPSGTSGLLVVLAGLVGAIAWKRDGKRRAGLRKAWRCSDGAPAPRPAGDGRRASQHELGKEADWR